ncbi:MAG: malto-oligosyltrehalose synthase [Tepidiformaceae bacterium]
MTSSSPIFAAAPGSTHGYDIIDHDRVNPELGGLPGLYSLHRVLAEHGIGLVLDIVPNHVGVAGGNPWWRDVLRFGQQSEFAAFFDIDWQGQPELPNGVLVYPCLGRPFGRSLEAGEFSLVYAGAEIVVRYYDRNFPISPASYQSVLGLPPGELAGGTQDPAAFAEFVELLESLPGRDVAGAKAALERFSGLLEREPALRAFVDEQLATCSGVPGDPASFDRLESILGQQHYRLADWRVSADETNYRRFFDVNDLAAVRVEHPPVFDAVHRLTGELVQRGIATGLRVDHIDGLFDPGEYIARLRNLVADAPTREDDPSFPIWVEKILGADEPLQPWPIAGTTGYDFLAIAGGILIDPAGANQTTSTYDEFVGTKRQYADIAFDARRLVAGRLFAGEVNVMSMQLHRLARRHRLHRDTTLESLRQALIALLAAMPIYRTYMAGDVTPAAAGELMREVAERAIRRDRRVSPEAMAFLVQVLLLEPDKDHPVDTAQWVQFRGRFQQECAPIAAKGIEDTTFFRFNRLLALNEVGNQPDRFGVFPAAAHQWLAERAHDWPAAISATSTHDTKRGEDVRARLSVLSERTRAWRREVRAWARLNRLARGTVERAPVPSPNMEYYLYQTLVATWEGDATAEYIDRIAGHFIKAMREAKEATSWMNVSEPHESAARAFVREILGSKRSARFRARLDGWVSGIHEAASINSLAMVALKCTAPGIPDFYQGTEVPGFYLTDPDNRMPVDFDRLAGLLDVLPGAAPPDPMERRAKLWMIRQLLALRRNERDLFLRGDYQPAQAEGPMAEHLFSFTRSFGTARLLVIVPRLVSDIVAPGGWSGSAFDGTTVDVPAAGPWTDALTGKTWCAQGGVLDAGMLLGAFPIAVLVSDAS